MPNYQKRIRATLRETERIYALIHPLDNEDESLNLYRARSRREDAVRATVLQMSLAIESLLNGLLGNALVGVSPGMTAARKKKKNALVPVLQDLLEGGKVGLDAKLKLARALRIISKRQYNRIDKLRALRNKCAHSWMLDAVHKRGRKPRISKRLLEYEGGNLFQIEVLEQFVHDFSGIYLKLYAKVLAL